MKRSDIQPMPEYFDRYINLVADTNLNEALENSVKDLAELNIYELEEVGNHTYAIDKWTIKEIFQHLTDVERIFCYRALLIARNDKSPAPEFNEKLMSIYGRANERTLTDIISELIIVRKSTIALFKSFGRDALASKGTNWKNEMNVLSF